MLSTTTEDDSDDCHYKGRRKQCREKVLQSSSSDSDDCIIARPRRKKCRVASSSSESDDSLLTRPSRKKCKVLSGTESSASSSSASDSDCDEKLRRWSDKRPKKRTITTDSEASSYEDDANPAKRRASNTTPTAATVADANSSDSDEGERCIICFKTLRPPLAHPSGCTHNFHPVCLATWSKTSNTCPIDRVKYTAIITVDSKGDLISREGVSSPPPQDHNADFEPDDATFCEVCSQHDREHEMLLCDRCEAGYHMDCLTPPLLEVPEGNWYCPRCEDLGLELREEINGLIDDAAVILESRMRRQQSTVRIPRGPRTRGAQRVFNIIHRQTGGQQPSTSSAVTISRQRGSSSRRPRHNSSRRAQSTRYKVELITVEDGTTLEVKVAVNTRTRTKSKRYKNRRTKKRCSKNARRSGESSSRRASENHVAGEGPSRPLDLFGSRPTLDYFSGCEAEDELDDDRGGQLGVLLRASRTGPRNMAARKQMAAQILNSSQRRVAPRIAVSSGPVDLVSSILEQQEKWHSPNASYESTSNGNIRVILKDKAGHSRQGGDTTTETSGSGTSSSQPPTSTSRADKPSTSTAPESGPSSHSPAHSQISSSSRSKKLSSHQQK